MFGKYPTESKETVILQWLNIYRAATQYSKHSVIGAKREIIESALKTNLAEGRVSMGLTVNRQMAKKSTVNRQKRNIFTVNRQMSEPKLAVKFLFLMFLNSFLNNFLKQFFFNFKNFFKQFFNFFVNF